MTVQHPIAWSMCVPGQHVWVLITQVSKRHCCEVLASGGMVVVMSWWLTRWPRWSFPASVILWFSDSVMILWFYDVLGQTWHNPVLAQHWFKAFGRKHSESLSLLLWKNYAGTIIPSMIFFFFFLVTIVPLQKVSSLYQIQAHMHGTPNAMKAEDWKAVP